mmetsp:Transcript_12532/g.27022  ORF Transcript_12532/g.27022 Transcript_12532/m.27022 type:complete len:228 (-) Transcript_12532:78-761(-)
MYEHKTLQQSKQCKRIHTLQVHHARRIGAKVHKIFPFDKMWVTDESHGQVDVTGRTCRVRSSTHGHIPPYKHPNNTYTRHHRERDELHTATRAGVELLVCPAASLWFGNHSRSKNTADHPSQPALSQQLSWGAHVPILQLSFVKKKHDPNHQPCTHHKQTNNLQTCARDPPLLTPATAALAARTHAPEQSRHTTVHSDIQSVDHATSPYQSEARMQLNTRNIKYETI